ncbi:hypothetical protein [Antarctobacter sp.]|nr:hypothetical protein [Antarctobacter sp.]
MAKINATKPKVMEERSRRRYGGDSAKRPGRSKVLENAASRV